MDACSQGSKCGQVLIRRLTGAQNSEIPLARVSSGQPATLPLLFPIFIVVVPNNDLERQSTRIPLKLCWVYQPRTTEPISKRPERTCDCIRSSCHGMDEVIEGNVNATLHEVSYSHEVPSRVCFVLNGPRGTVEHIQKIVDPIWPTVLAVIRKRTAVT